MTAHFSSRDYVRLLQAAAEHHLLPEQLAAQILQNALTRRITIRAEDTPARASGSSA